MADQPKVPSAFSAYWSAYGGWQSLFRSSYLHISLAPALLLWPAWQIDEKINYSPWVDLAFQVIPSLISFSLGSLAIILSLSSGLFLSIIQESGKSDSLFMKMVAVFFHFIFVQFICVFLAIACKFINFVPLSFLGFWFFSYALATGIAAAVNLVGLAQLKNKSAILEPKKPPARGPGVSKNR